MKKIERFNLIDRIGRELQSRMSYSDIDIFLQGFGVNTKKPTSGANSKWVYSKELLADATDELIIRIADELDIVHGHTLVGKALIEDSRFWTPGYLRVFISHLSQHKVRATQLKDALRKYAISAFVAHEDIEPTLEWQTEIERALFSMDALIAILTPGFRDSNWTDQEMGIALGRNVLIIPLRKGLDPYGFVGKIQGLQAEGKTVGQVSELVFQVLSSNVATKNKLANAISDQVIAAKDIESGFQFLNHLRNIDSLSQSHLEKIRDNLATNQILSNDESFVISLNKILTERKLSSFINPEQTEVFDDDIPF